MLMIDFEPAREDHVDGEEFVALARRVLRLRNTGNFHDDWVQIRTNHNGLDLEITRNRQIVGDNTSKSHLGVSNPTTMVVDGEIIRHHGEHAYLTQHLRNIVSKELQNIRREVIVRVIEAAQAHSDNIIEKDGRWVIVVDGRTQTMNDFVASVGHDVQSTALLDRLCPNGWDGQGVLSITDQSDARAVFFVMRNCSGLYAR